MSEQPLRVLVVDDSGMMRSMLSQLIEGQADMRLAGTASSGHEAVQRAIELQPDVVLMDVHMPDLDGIQATWLVSSKLPNGAVIMVTSEERLDFLQRAMAAGAQGYVLKPFGDGTELLKTMHEVHARGQGRRLAATAPAVDEAASGQARPRRGKRLVVVGTKGGLGRTIVAVSLALGLRQQTKGAVVLVDADFLFGDADLHLDLTPQRTILDLVPHMDALDQGLVEQVVTKHVSGVHLLARPPRPEQADAVTDEHMRTLLDTLAQMYDWIVLDTPPSYDDRMLAGLDLADVYVIVMSPHMGALRNTRHFLDVAHKLGYPQERMCFVLNRANSAVDLSLDGVASVIGTRRILQLPSVGPQPTRAFNHGRPFLSDQAGSPLTKALLALSEHVRLLAA